MEGYELMGDGAHVWREYGDEDVLHWNLCKQCRDDYVAPTSFGHWCPGCDGEQDGHDDGYLVENLSLDRLARALEYDLLADARVEAFLVMRYGLLAPCGHLHEGRRPAGFGERCHLCRNEIGDEAPVFVAHTRRELLWDYGTEDLEWLLAQYMAYEDNEGRRSRREEAEDLECRENSVLPDEEDSCWRSHPDEYFEAKFDAECWLLQLREHHQPDARYLVVHPDADGRPGKETYQHFFNRAVAWEDYQEWNHSGGARFIVCDEVEMTRRLDQRIERREVERQEELEAAQFEVELGLSRADAEADMRDWFQED